MNKQTELTRFWNLDEREYNDFFDQINIGELLRALQYSPNFHLCYIAAHDYSEKRGSLETFFDYDYYTPGLQFSIISSQRLDILLNRSVYRKTKISDNEFNRMTYNQKMLLCEHPLWNTVSYSLLIHEMFKHPFEEMEHTLFFQEYLTYIKSFSTDTWDNTLHEDKHKKCQWAYAFSILSQTIMNQSLGSAASLEDIILQESIKSLYDKLDQNNEKNTLKSVRASAKAVDKLSWFFSDLSKIFLNLHTTVPIVYEDVELLM